MNSFWSLPLRSNNWIHLIYLKSPVRNYLVSFRKQLTKIQYCKLSRIWSRQDGLSGERGANSYQGILELQGKTYTSQWFIVQEGQNHKFLKCVISFVTTARSCHSVTIWKKLRWKSHNITLSHFKEYHRNQKKKLKVYMVLGDAVSTLQMFVWIWNHVSRTITSSPFTPKASILVKRQLWTWSFMWLCQFLDWLKIETRPSSLCNSRIINTKHFMIC